jgi:hypothetical protein
MKLLREPLVHFLFIGAAIYLAFGLLAEPVEDLQDNTLVVDAGEIEWMATSWHKRWNRMPTQQELDGLIQQYVRETILYREALAMGLDQDDTIIRRRLAQKLEFLAQDLALMTPPTDEELLSYFDEHKDRYQQPTRYTFTQVYIDPDKRGDKTLDDAKAIKAALISKPEQLDNAADMGDDFMLQAYYPENSQANIRKNFGSGFAEALVELTAGEWHGPVLSGYGTHLVYVHGIIEPPAPVFASVRERVQQDWEDARRETMNEQFYASLRDRYDIVIEMPEQDNKVAALQEQTQ